MAENVFGMGYDPCKRCNPYRISYREYSVAGQRGSNPFLACLFVYGGFIYRG